MKINFTSKSGETLVHQDLVVGVDFDTINDPTEIDKCTEEIYEQEINEIFEDNTMRVGQTTRNSLVEDVETVDEATEDGEDMQQVIDELIEELEVDILPAGEDLFNNMAEESEE